MEQVSRENTSVNAELPGCNHGAMRRHRTITPSVLYFGTPVAVISTVNLDGTTNLAPVSSFWALDDLLVLGLGAEGHTVANLRERPELVINLPDDSHWQEVETLGRTTGASPVPAAKPASTTFVHDKFEEVGWHPLAATTVRPARVAELPVHIEARATRVDEEDGGLVVVHARSTAVHVDDSITLAGTSYIDPSRWRPLIYSFRHYYGLGRRRGIAQRAEVQR